MEGELAPSIHVLAPNTCEVYLLNFFWGPRLWFSPRGIQLSRTDACDKEKKEDYIWTRAPEWASEGINPSKLQRELRAGIWGRDQGQQGQGSPAVSWTFSTSSSGYPRL
jgi:hypothetical protein